MPNNQSHDPTVALPMNRLAQAVALSVAAIAGSAPEPQSGSGYVAFDVPLIRHATTGDSVSVRLVRRRGNTGSLSVTVSAQDYFRPQGLQSFPNTVVTFSEGEMTKIVSLPLNSVTLDGESHIKMAITGNSMTYDPIRWGETNCIVVVDDGSVAAGMPVLDDPSAQIVQDYYDNDTIVYLRDTGGPWDDASAPGYTSADPYASRQGSVIIDKNNLVVRSYPGDSPVFATNGSSPIQLLDSGYVYFYGLECGDATGKNTRTGINVDNEQGYEGQQKVNGPYVIDSCHFHHIYGGDNTGGVRLDFMQNGVVFNCLIHDIYDTRSTPGNPYTSEVYGFHAGIHGYGPRGCVLMQNTFYNVKRPIYQKNPNEFFDASHLVARNFAYDHQYGMATFETAGSGADAMKNAAVFENISLIAPVTINVRFTADNQTASGALIYNNTCPKLGSFHKITEIQIWNNLFFGLGDADKVMQGKNDDDVSGFGVTYCDYNGYGNPLCDFEMDQYGVDGRVYASLTDWQNSQQTTDGFNLFVVDNPDANAQTGEPVFVNAAANDYHLTSANTQYIGTGRFGENMGAYRLGHEQIGSTL